MLESRYMFNKHFLAPTHLLNFAYFATFSKVTLLVKSTNGRTYMINDVIEFRSSLRLNPTTSNMELFSLIVEGLKLLSSRAPS